MTTYAGLPVPEIRPFLTREASVGKYAPGVTFAIDVIELCGNTGTYIDSPFHRHADGDDLAGLSLERLVDVPAVRVDVTGSASPASRPASSRRTTSAAAPSSSIPASPATGERTPTSAATRS